MPPTAGAVVVSCTQARHPFIVWATDPAGRIQVIPVVRPGLPHHRADETLTWIDIMGCGIPLAQAVAECGRLRWRKPEMFVPVGHVTEQLWRRLACKVARERQARSFEEKMDFSFRSPFLNDILPGPMA